ncbi:MAG: phage N-6-adenine-methyltransferase [Thermoplasmata archaeon]|nr:phage N-6-adenine-methyltransferase [Thermoplasmata archaeon]
MSDDYETPRWLLDIAFPDGYFDPCPIRGKKNGPDGLKIDWPTDRPVFINPPYSGVERWIQRAVAHPGPVAMLLLVDPGAPWWHMYADQFKVVLITQKVRFNRWDDKNQRNLLGKPAFRTTMPRDMAGRTARSPGAAGAARGAMLGLNVCWWWKDGDRGR